MDGVIYFLALVVLINTVLFCFVALRCRWPHRWRLSSETVKGATLSL